MEESDFINSTFIDPFERKEECLICLDVKTKYYFQCCQKPICNKCFVNCYIKNNNLNCVHCREILFENYFCNICSERHFPYDVPCSEKEKYISRNLVKSISITYKNYF